MKQSRLKSIRLENFKSIRKSEVELKSMNILIGANGAGKSNFISVFPLLSNLFAGKLQFHVNQNGGPDAVLHFGRKQSGFLGLHVELEKSGYSLTLEPTVDNRLIFKEESAFKSGKAVRSFHSGSFETGFTPAVDEAGLVAPHLGGIRVHHFQDTSNTALLKQMRNINDNDSLQPDGSNIAAFLYRLSKHHKKHYSLIVNAIRMVAPFFDDFRLRPHPDNPDMMELEWLELGNAVPFKAHILSDGTLRFICLATLLLQPKAYRPGVIVIDEPELGLHPHAVHLLAGMLKSAATESQIIAATQSLELLNEFEAADVIVADRYQNSTVLHRLDEMKLADWLKDYSLGELWERNILGGGLAR